MNAPFNIPHPKQQSVRPSAALLTCLTMKERANDDDGDGGDDTTLVVSGVPERVQDYDTTWARNHRIGRTHEVWVRHACITLRWRKQIKMRGNISD